MASALDDEIERLRERAALLRKQLQVQTSTLLSAESTARMLRQDTAPSNARTRTRLLALHDAHAAHRQQCAYRAGASVTAFRVQDPDPRAADGGRVLGLRFDVMMGAQFLRPYYVLLHRDEAQTVHSKANPWLRVHRHTVPPAVPLAGLAARYLGAGTSSSAAKRRRQAAAAGSEADADDEDDDLYGFARALRRALVRYHNRLAVVGDLRRVAPQQQQQQQRRPTAGDAAQEDGSGGGLADVSAADAEAKQIRLDWADGRTGRLVLDDDGSVEQLVVVGAAGMRDRAAARTLLAGATTATALVRAIGGGGT